MMSKSARSRTVTTVALNARLLRLIVKAGPLGRHTNTHSHACTHIHMFIYLFFICRHIYIYIYLYIHVMHIRNAYVYV